MAPSVKEFYEGKSILITGATGFLGKVMFFIIVTQPRSIDSLIITSYESERLLPY